MDRWIDGWREGWIDGWMNGWMDGWMDGWGGPFHMIWDGTCSVSSISPSNLLNPIQNACN